MENQAHGKESHLKLSSRSFNCKTQKAIQNWASLALKKIQNKNLPVDICMFLSEEKHFAST